MKKKEKYKIGILTWHYANNVGSNLQAYALAKSIEKINSSYCIINYRGKYKKNLIKIIIKKVCNILDNLLPGLLPRNIRFSSYKFQNKFLKMTQYYSNEDDLSILNTQFDIFLCGSDQIWAPNVLDDNYLLPFVDDGKKKYSYATSLGLSEIPNGLKEKYRLYLKRFDYVTLREKEGALLIGNIIDKDVPWVLDPTFLLNNEEWKKISIKYNSFENYIFCYFLGENEKYRDIVQKMSEILHCKVICLSKIKADKIRKWKVITSIDPREFLGFIENAKIIMTDSFHGMALSINYEKQFYVFNRFKEDDKICQNSRISNILNYLELNSRLIHENVTTIECEDIDYMNVKKKLDKKRGESLEILKNMLSQS